MRGSCEGNWLEPFLNGSVLKDRCDECGFPILGTVLLLNSELMIKVIAGTVLSYSWSFQQLLV